MKSVLLLSNEGEEAVEPDPVFPPPSNHRELFHFQDTIPFMCSLERVDGPGGCKALKPSGRQGM